MYMYIVRSKQLSRDRCLGPTMTVLYMYMYMYMYIHACVHHTVTQ